MKSHVCLVVLAIGFLLIQNSCGGGNAQLASPGPSSLGSNIIKASLPALPEGTSFDPLRIATYWSDTKAGDQRFDMHPANVTIVPGVAQFRAPADDTAWAMYQFFGSPGDVIDTVGYMCSYRGAADDVWIAVSNYDKGSWEYLDPQPYDGASVAVGGATGAYSSPAGHTYVLIVAWDGAEFDLDSVTVNYANRYNVSGQVVDEGGTGVPDVAISMSLGGPPVITDASGNFTLEAVPDGTWHIMATRAGWSFFNNPSEVTVSGGDVSGANFLGYISLSHYAPAEDEEPNDFIFNAPTRAHFVPIEEYISASDDQFDYYKIDLPASMDGYFKLDAHPQVMFPRLTIYSEAGSQIATSPWIGSGVAFCPIPLAAPRTIILGVTCSGGGGKYTVTYDHGDFNLLEGDLRDGGANGVGYIPITLSYGPDSTVMYPSYFSGTYTNNYLPPIPVEVAPQDPEGIHNFTPPLLNVNLAMGDVTNADFLVGVSGMLINMFEPNNTFATAHPLTLPLIVPPPGNLISNSDNQDWFVVTPPNGEYLRASVEFYDHPRDSWSSPIDLRIYDDTGMAVVGWGWRTEEGMEARTSVQCNGSNYYICVSTSQDKIFYYDLLAESYEGCELDIGVLRDGNGIGDADVRITSRDYGWTLNEQTQNSNGRTDIGFMFKEGEVVFAEVFRYGFSCDGHTAEITVTSPSKLHWFKADDTSIDTLEPNNHSSVSKAIDYHDPIDATLSQNNDFNDYYRFTPDSDDDLRVLFTTPNKQASFQAIIVKTATATQLGMYTWTGDAEFALPLDGIEEYRFELRIYDGECKYHMELSQGPAYSITGTIRDNMSTPLSGVYVYCMETAQSAYTPMDGSYDLGFVQPGTYHIYCYFANYDIVPASPKEIVVSNADIIQDFTFTPASNDNYEPNDNSATAHPVTPGDYSANLEGFTGDYQDWYIYNVAAPSDLLVVIEWPAWQAAAYLELYDAGLNKVATSTLWQDAYNRIDYHVSAPGNYYIKVYGGTCQYNLHVIN